MRSFVLLSTVGLVRADYLDTTVYAASIKCDGPTIVSYASFIGCQSYADETMSFEVQCTSEKGANLAYYTNSNDCSGASLVLPYDTAFGCVAGTGNGTLGSSVNKCMTGVFDPQPEGAALISIWVNNNTCPPTGTAFQVEQFELGVCIPASSTQSYEWECDETNASLRQVAYLTPTCDGQSFTGGSFPLGCVLDPSGSTMQTTCNNVGSHSRQRTQSTPLGLHPFIGAETLAELRAAAEKATRDASEAILLAWKSRNP